MKPWDWPDPWDWLSAIAVACVIWFLMIGVGAWLR